MLRRAVRGDSASVARCRGARHEDGRGFGVRVHAYSRWELQDAGGVGLAVVCSPWPASKHRLPSAAVGVRRPRPKAKVE